MKKTFLAITAFAAVLAGCSKEIETTNTEIIIPEGEVVTLRASVPETDTKVTSDNVGAFKWQASDKITVLNTSGTAYEFTAAAGGTSVDFSSDTFTGTLSTEAMYPASSNHAAGKFYLEPSFTWSSDAAMMPMLGTVNTSDETASFKSAGAVLKLICFNVDDDARKLVVTSDTKQIVGLFTPSGTPKVIATADKSESNNILTINFAAGHASNMVFYIPLPTGNVGTLTFAFKDGSDTPIFEKTTKAAVTLTRNQLVLVPALNCDPTIVLWRETFTNYSTSPAKTWESAEAMNVGGSYDAEKYGDATITYLTAGSTSVRTGTNAGGTTPELSFDKSTPNTFTVSGIPTNGASTMQLTFNASADCITVGSTTEGVTVTGLTYDSGAKTYTATINNSSASSLTLVFNNTDSSNYQRIDNPQVIIAGSSATAPIIISENVNLTIGIGTLSKSTTVGITGAVDGLGLSYVLSQKDAKSMAWVKSVVIADGKLTVTANDANGEAEDREAIVTLKATGAANKEINLKQTSALVQKPSTISILPGNKTITASWTKADHATGYLAYLCTDTGLADPTATGTALTPELDGSTYTVTKSGLTNGEDYYVYVKVNTVDSNYIADSEWAESAVITPEAVIYYEKITAVGQIETGVKYLIVRENSESSKAFDGSLTTLDAANDIIDVTIADSKIVSNSTTNASSFTITGSTDSYYIKSASGYYIGRATGTNGLDQSDETQYPHSITFSDGNALICDSESGTSEYLKFNTNRFRYYATGQSAITLYKLNDPRAAAGIVWKKSGVEASSDSATMLTGDDTMPTISLYNPNSLTVTYASSDTDVATINASTGVITLVGAGTTTISADFAEGDEDYRPANVTYLLTVTDSRTTPVITLDESTENRTDSDYSSFTGRSATASPTVPLTYTKTDASNIISSLNASTGAITLNGNTGSATVTVSFAGNSEYKPAVSKSYVIKVTSASGPSKLDPPASPTITLLGSATFTATWTAAEDAQGYEWVLSTTADVADEVTSGNIASGSTTTVTQTGLSLSSGQAYYFIIKTKGDGDVNFSDSNYLASASKSYTLYTTTWTASSGALGSGIGSGTINTTVSGSATTQSWSYTRTLSSGDSYTGWSSDCIQLGKNGGVENLTISTSNIPGIIKSVSVECSSYQAKHNIAISVGDTSYLAKTATASWTTVSAKSGSGNVSGTITISFTDGSRALYIKSITVTYEN